MRGWKVEEIDYLKSFWTGKRWRQPSQKWYDKRAAKRKAQRLARRKNRKK